MTSDQGPEKTPLVLNLAEVLAFLDAACEIAERIHGTTVLPEERTNTRGKRGIAELSSDVLRAAALCNAAGAHFELKYWELKSRPDPRKDDAGD